MNKINGKYLFSFHHEGFTFKMFIELCLTFVTHTFIHSHNGNDTMVKCERNADGAKNQRKKEKKITVQKIIILGACFLYTIHLKYYTSNAKK